MTIETDVMLLPLCGGDGSCIAETGGKAASLMRMASAGLPVPPGFVLTTSFFTSWFDAIRASETWTQLAVEPPDSWGRVCSDLRRQASAMSFSAAQSEALNMLRSELAALGDMIRLAVRSSSPAEDMASASFAGLYETRLGVQPQELEGALLSCFASASTCASFGTSMSEA